MFPNKKVIGYSYREQFRDLAPALALSIAMVFIVWGIEWLRLNPLVTLLLQVVVGAVVYVTGSILFKMESYYYLLNFFKK